MNWHTQRRIMAELDALRAEVDVLKHLQAETAAELDSAVLTAYGFSAKEDLLAQLPALNQQIAANIEKGEPVTAPGRRVLDEHG